MPFIPNAIYHLIIIKVIIQKRIFFMTAMITVIFRRTYIPVYYLIFRVFLFTPTLSFPDSIANQNLYFLSLP